MLPPTAGIAQEQRDRPEMAYQQRRDVRELTREIIRDARVANRQQSMSPGGKPVEKRRHVSAIAIHVKTKLTYVKVTLYKNKAFSEINTQKKGIYPEIYSKNNRMLLNLGLLRHQGARSYESKMAPTRHIDRLLYQYAFNYICTLSFIL